MLEFSSGNLLANKRKCLHNTDLTWKFWWYLTPIPLNMSLEKLKNMCKATYYWTTPKKLVFFKQGKSKTDRVFHIYCIARWFPLLSTGSVAMRYPDRHHGGQIPHDAYSDSAAKTAKSLASQILEKCQAYIISQVLIWVIIIYNIAKFIIHFRLERGLLYVLGAK